MSALIIFIEQPDAFRNETAHKEQITEADAHADGAQSLMHLRSIIKDIPGEKFLFYRDYPNWNDAWDINIYRKRIQQGDTAGERMTAALEQAFEEGHDRAMIIGNDCHRLTSEIILEGMDALNGSDLVIGPADNGSFYLLGMKGAHPDFFAHTPPDLANVQPRASIVLPDLGLSCYILPQLPTTQMQQD